MLQSPLAAGSASIVSVTGAEVIGDQDLIAKIQQVGSSAIAFDTCLGTRDMMPQLTKIARVLGPRGLMPNPKLGTLIEPGGMQSAVSAMKRGRVEYRWDLEAASLSSTCNRSHLHVLVQLTFTHLVQHAFYLHGH